MSTRARGPPDTPITTILIDDKEGKMTETSRDPRAGWTQRERELYDAKADEEAWSHARSIIGPFVQVSREVGSPELSRVMEKALAEVEGEVNRTVDVLEALEKRGGARD